MENIRPEIRPQSNIGLDISSAQLQSALDDAQRLFLSQQAPEGFWWYTLEANESIGAEYIFLEHFIGSRTSGLWERLAKRMLQTQASDGSWSLASGETGDLSTTTECYVALRMAGYSPKQEPLQRASQFIRENGGISRARVFTKIHFALLGIVDWSEPPAMPVEVMLLSHKLPFSIYEFSSWARACIVPLLVIMAKRPIYPLIDIDIQDELKCDFMSHNEKGRRDVWAEFFHWNDKILKLVRPLSKFAPSQQPALRKAERWIREHIAQTEDIFPALAYGALALHVLGARQDDPAFTKALRALRRFQHEYDAELPALPFACHDDSQYEQLRVRNSALPVHQQCCISPVWDTPWMVCALAAGGTAPDHPAIRRAAEWLLSKQVSDVRGDWSLKNGQAEPGGWSFEFENDFFPDIDDTIQVLHALRCSNVDAERVRSAEQRALAWCISMQNKDGGWAAFDKNNSLELVNKIPFSDHGACLDPSSPDITGRMLELLAKYDYSMDDPVVQRAVAYLRNTQETDGSWFGRWGVNYLYGTWAATKGLAAIGFSPEDPALARAAEWIESVQQADGGFGESVSSYPAKQYVEASSCPSQTAWGLMTLLALGRASTPSALRAAQFLLAQQNAAGGWDEQAYTGTGFPGHFYIRYHGYRHYFPALALGLYAQARG